MPNYLNAKKTSPKTHSLKTVKSQWQIILKAARETRMVTHKGTPIRLSVDFLAETRGQEKSGHSQNTERKIASGEYSIQQSYHSDMKEKERFSQTHKSWGNSSTMDLPLRSAERNCSTRKKGKKVHKSLSKGINSIRKLPLYIRITF